MNPIFTAYAEKFCIPPKPAEIKQKVLIEADDPQLLADVNVMLGSRNGKQFWSMTMVSSTTFLSIHLCLIR